MCDVYFEGGGSHMNPRFYILVFATDTENVVLRKIASLVGKHSRHDNFFKSAQKGAKIELLGKVEILNCIKYFLLNDKAYITFNFSFLEIH